MRLYPIGTTINGWRLMRTRKPHDCAECGRPIAARRGAWFRVAPGLGAHDRGAGEYIGQSCCQWRVEEGGAE